MKRLSKKCKKILRKSKNQINQKVYKCQKYVGQLSKMCQKI